jgi:hypothetical protein
MTMLKEAPKRKPRDVSAVITVPSPPLALLGGHALSLDPDWDLFGVPLQTKPEYLMKDQGAANLRDSYRQIKKSLVSICFHTGIQ